MLRNQGPEQLGVDLFYELYPSSLYSQPSISSAFSIGKAYKLSSGEQELLSLSSQLPLC